MRRRIVWIIVAVPLVLITVSAGTAAAFPAPRHILFILSEPGESTPQI